MRVLVITQKVDSSDPLLGFFHGWLKEFAQRFETITVICLGKDKYDLPKNVFVFSLGKESRKSRFCYLYNFYRILWKERRNYDAVFVHMNQEYVLFGGLIWRAMGKKVIFWRNHPSGTFLTRIAVLLSNIVLCTSPHSYTARFKKTISSMPVGIDTDTFFDKKLNREHNSILSIGRISPVKNVLGIIEMLKTLKDTGWGGNAYLYGSAPSRDALYEQWVNKKAATLISAKKLHFAPNVSYENMPRVYNSYELYINLTPTGSFDKVIFEAMASGMMVVASNQSFINKIPSECICHEEDIEDFTKKVQQYFEFSSEKKNEIKTQLKLFVKKEQSLGKLADRLVSIFA